MRYASSQAPWQPRWLRPKCSRETDRMLMCLRAPHTALAAECGRRTRGVWMRPRLWRSRDSRRKLSRRAIPLPASMAADRVPRSNPDKMARVARGPYAEQYLVLAGDFGGSIVRAVAAWTSYADRTKVRPAGNASRGQSAELIGAPGRTRTCDARFRKPTLCPLSYGGCGAV